MSKFNRDAVVAIWRDFSAAPFDHEIVPPSYQLDEGPAYCTVCGRAIYIEEWPERIGPWKHIGDETMQAEAEVRRLTEQMEGR